MSRHIHGKNERVRAAKPRSADYNQDRAPLIEANNAVGHAVRAGYTYAAMTDIAALCDDLDYRRALDRIWKDVVERKLYISGGSATAQYYDEGFGDPYYLPNGTAYCETCGTIASVLWCHRMALLHADATYIDQRKKVYWGERIRGANLKLPKSWRVLYKEGSTWRPVESADSFSMHLDQLNEVRFKTIKTTAVRLEVILAEAPCGIQEWLID